MIASAPLTAGFYCGGCPLQGHEMLVDGGFPGLTVIVSVQDCPGGQLFPLQPS
jgi:hypothetical protein